MAMIRRRWSDLLDRARFWVLTAIAWAIVAYVFGDELEQRRRISRLTISTGPASSDWTFR